MLRPLDCGAEERRKRIRTPWSGMVNDCLADGLHKQLRSGTIPHGGQGINQNQKQHERGVAHGAILGRSSVEHYLV